MDASAARPGLPRRAELSARTRRAIKRGGRWKADLLLVDADDGPVVVKDFGAKHAVARGLGRLQIRREVRAYGHAGALEGLPRMLGRIDAWAFALEWIDGELLATAPDRVTRGARHVARLREVIDRLHARGVAHLDLRSNKNVILARDGSIHVVDLAAAICFSPGSLAWRLLFPRLRDLDLSGWLKWKLVLEAGPLSDEEQALLRRTRRFSRFWLVNPKQRPR